MRSPFGRRSQRSPSDLPPGSVPGPSGRLLSTYRLFSGVLTWVPRWLEHYGDPVRVPTLTGDFVLTADPALVKQLFATNPDHLHPFTPPGSSIFATRSVIQLRGQEHRARRKLLMPPFHGKRMRGFAEAMHQAAHATFERASEEPEVRFVDLARSITQDVILRTVFGVQGPQLTRTFKQAVGELTRALTPTLLSVSFLHRDFGGLGPYARYRRALERLDVLLQQQIERTRQGGLGDDILSMLLAARHEDGTAMDDSEVRNELTTLLFAGHETTATALCWALDAIGRHPELHQALRQERDGLGPDPEPTALAALGTLEAVGKETLRLYPIVPIISRVLAVPMELGGHLMPAGTVMGICTAAMHQREEIYPDPACFRPERFIGRKFHPYQYLPFGGGHRRCIGVAFAEFELQIVLGTLLGAFDFELRHERPPRAVRRNITLAPHDGVPVRIRRRAARPRALAA